MWYIIGIGRLRRDWTPQVPINFLKGVPKALINVVCLNQVRAQCAYIYTVNYFVLQLFNKYSTYFNIIYVVIIIIIIIIYTMNSIGITWSATIIRVRITGHIFVIGGHHDKNNYYFETVDCARNKLTEIGGGAIWKH